MSAQNVLSRREALSLLGVTTGSVVVTTLSAQAAGTQSHEVIAAATASRPQYIFGYGSLIDRQSRLATWPSAELASPVVVKGVARGYLGGVADEGAECNGVIFRVTPAEFNSFTQRETGYRPTEIDPPQVTMLDGGSAAPDGDIWYFANRRKRLPSAVHPGDHHGSTTASILGARSCTCRAPGRSTS